MGRQLLAIGMLSAGLVILAHDGGTAQQKAVYAGANVASSYAGPGLEYLIRSLNPYSYNMDIFVGNPDPNEANPTPDLSQVDLEQWQIPVDWKFKDLTRHVNKSIRIKYRYQDAYCPPGYAYQGSTKSCVDGTGAKANPVYYWVDDYLLIGFEGSGGP